MKPFFKILFIWFYKKLNLRLLDIIDNSLKDITKNLKETAAKLKSK